MSNPNQDPRKLKGGAKQMWLRQNRGLVLKYIAKHGLPVAMLKFGISYARTLDSLIDQEPEGQEPATTGEVRQANLKSESAIELARDAHIEIRKLREAYFAFVQTVGEDLTKKLFLPLLRLCIKLDNPIFDLPPDNLSLDWLFSDTLEAKQPAQLEGRQVVDLLSMAEVETIRTGTGDSLAEKLKAAKANLFEDYLQACDREDWYSALTMRQYLDELHIIQDEDEGEELERSLTEWLPKAQNPWELDVCY